MLFTNPEEVVFQWVSRVCHGKPADIASLYDERAVLIPTFSPHTVNSPEAIMGYFEQLATRKGVGVKLHDKSLRTQSMNDTIHTLSGVYSFEFEVDQVLLSFPSRFTFVVDLSREKPILHHHSSQVPRNLS
ncbi:MAG: nuclear transport factor 2 family protein [Chlorobi bacterium]|nr:nuclear transport factor 2 family protein [Chlorobiota bacterium]